VEKGFPDLILRALGKRIRELRSKQGYSQEGFADKCGVHRTFMGTIERGESNLSLLNIAKVASALDITLSTLFLEAEVEAQILGAQPTGTAASKPKKRNTPSKRAL